MARKRTKRGASRRRGKLVAVLVAAAVAVWVVAGYFAVTGPHSLLTRDGAVTPAPSAAPVPATPGAAPVASATAPAAPRSAAPTAATSSSATRPPDTSACVAALFPPQSFRHKPDFSFLCTQPNPRTGGTAVRAQVVLRAGGEVTDGMREWAGLGWYETAAYSLLRARCCASPPPLHWSFDLVCPLDRSLARLEQAVVAQDGAGIDEAIRDYSKQVRCLSKFGQATNFGQTGSPGPGITMLNRLLQRARGGSESAAR